MPLRPYQQQAVDSIIKYFKDGNKGHPLAVLSTGAGKTHVLGGFLNEVHNRWGNIKVLILSHVSEILVQNHATLLDYLPFEKVGLYSAGLGSRDVNQYTVAGIQSVCNKADLFKDVKVIIVDECHLIPPSGEGRYRTFFEQLPDARIIGLTATPYRLGLGKLTDGDLFDKIVYDKGVKELIKEGYLTHLTCKETDTKMSVRGVKKTAGDFNVKEMSNKLDVTSISNSIITELCKHKETRKHWLVFAIDIAHAEHITELLNKAGISSACVHSKMKGDRKELIQLFKAGVFQCLVSIETLTTGFDAPNIDLVALLRPTTSPVLHVQMIGRGLRIAEGKENCLILDFAGNIERLGPIDDVVVPTPGLKSDTRNVTKACNKCKEIVPMATQYCPVCNYKFFDEQEEIDPFDKLLGLASNESVLSTGSRKSTYSVLNVRYSVHRKEGKPPSMLVTYICATNTVKEWVCFEHEGFAQQKAFEWWRKRGGLHVPRSTQDAIKLSERLDKPSEIVVEESGAFPVIKRYKYKEKVA